MNQATPDLPKHELYEDVLAIICGTLVVSLGLTLYSGATLVTNGLAGAALLVQHATGWPFAVAFLALNAPFYALALVRLGRAAAIRTLVAVLLVAAFAQLTPRWLQLAALDPLYAAVAGGALIGIGLLILFRHRTALGGTNVLAIYLQERHGLRAGYVQLAIDLAILATASIVVPLDKLALSVLGAVILNLLIAINHRPGRYMAMS